jgi:hypothetical protein
MACRGGAGVVMKEQAAKKWKSRVSGTKDRWASDYFKKNPIRSMASGLTSIGLIAIFSYHFHIEYAPNFDIKSLASTVFLAAFVGLCFSAAYSVLISFPLYFVSAHALSGERDESEVEYKIVTSFMLSGVTFLGFSIFLFTATEFKLPPQTIVAIPLTLALIYLLCKSLSTSVPVHATALSYNDPTRWQDWPWRMLRTKFIDTIPAWYEANARALRIVGFMLLIFLMQAFPVQMYFMIMQGAPSLDTDRVDWSLLSFQLFIICVMLQGIGIYVTISWRQAAPARTHKFYSLMLFLLAPFLVTFVGGNPSFFPCSVAYMLKIGNFATNEITLTSAGCDVVAGRGGPACSQKAGTVNKIYGAYVMSRIGTEVFLKIKDLGGGSPVCIYLPAKEVLGMKIDESKRFYNTRSIAKFLSSDSTKCKAYAA